MASTHVDGGMDTTGDLIFSLTSLRITATSLSANWGCKADG